MRKKRLVRGLVALGLVILGGVGIGIGVQNLPVVMAEETEGATGTSESAEASGTEEAQGSNSTSFSVSPMNQEIILTPGETWSGSITVRNPYAATQNLKFSVEVKSFSMKPTADSHGGDNGTVDLDDVTSRNDMMNWITLGVTEGEVEPNGTMSIPFTITVPADAPGGGQYASIAVTNETSYNGAGGGVDIQSTPQIASVIFAEVAGDTVKEGKVLENSVPTFLLSGDLQTTSMVENTGNTHEEVEYTLQVWPLFSNEEICTNEEEPIRKLVMPESKTYNMQECKVGPVGIYKVKQAISYFGQPSEAEKLVFVCPVWLILIIVVAVVLVICLIVKRVRG